MTFLDFCALTKALAATRSRLTKTSHTAEFLRRLTPEEVPFAVAFLTARPFPAADSRVLEVSWATLSELLNTVEPPRSTASLMLLDVAARFGAIADASGPGSKRRKQEHLAALFGTATDNERQVLSKILVGEMRIGLHEGLIQDAIARAADVDPELVRRAALFLSDLSEVARIALTEGAGGLQRIGPR